MDKVMHHYVMILFVPYSSFFILIFSHFSYFVFLFVCFVSSRSSVMFHNVIFVPHELYHGLFQWAPSTPLREESPRRVFSPLSSSPDDSPRSFPDIYERVPESFAGNSSLSESLCDVLEAFRLF